MYRNDMNGVPYNHPSIPLEKAEIAKVCNEISTNYGRYREHSLIMLRTLDQNRDWCIYYVENRGYGDYNIYEKYYD